MKKFIALVMTLMLALSLAVAEDVPAETEAFVPSQNVKVELTMTGDLADGFICIPEIKHNGTENTVVSLDSMHYANGQFSFSFSPLTAGEAIVVLEYGKPQDHFVVKQQVYMIVVTEEGLIEVRDMSEQLPLTGTVKEVTEEGVLLETAEQGEVLCRLPEGMTAPLQDELIQVWFNGVMTMSMPGQINVLAWEVVNMQAR